MQKKDLRTIKFDKTAPTLTSLSISSNNTYNSSMAKVGDVVKEGDEVSVKVVGFDRGKVKLSMKQASA